MINGYLTEQTWEPGCVLKNRAILTVSVLSCSTFCNTVSCQSGPRILKENIWQNRHFKPMKMQ